MAPLLHGGVGVEARRERDGNRRVRRCQTAGGKKCEGADELRMVRGKTAGDPVAERVSHQVSGRAVVLDHYGDIGRDVVQRCTGPE